MTRKGIFVAAVAGCVCVWVVLSAPGAAASSWSVVPTVDPVGSATSIQLNQVSCTPGGMCVAIGQYLKTTPGRTIAGEDTFAERWNGANWSLIRTPQIPRHAASIQLKAVSCVSASECVAVGYWTTRSGYTEALIERLQRGAWTIESGHNIPSTINSRLDGVSCAGPKLFCIAVGSGSRKGRVVRLLDERQAGKWQTQHAPGWAPLRVVFCRSARFCMAVGGSTLRWDGHSWKRAAAGLRGNNLWITGLACTSASACEAVGAVEPTPSSSSTFAQGWNGSRWTAQPSASLGSGLLSGVSCPRLGPSATACYAVGYTTWGYGYPGSTLVESYNGATWTVQPPPNAASSPVPGQLFDSLTGISCWTTNTRVACMAVGSYSDSPGGSHTLAEEFS